MPKTTWQDEQRSYISQVGYSLFVSPELSGDVRIQKMVILFVFRGPKNKKNCTESAPWLYKSNPPYEYDVTPLDHVDSTQSK